MATNKEKAKPTKLPEKTVEEIEIDAIRRDGGTQPRARLNEETIDDYVQSLHEGAQYPPVTLYYDGKEYWLADGFHRIKAHEEFGRKHISAEIRTGTRRDAVLYSVGANASHGLRRSRADKRRAVETLLNDQEWRKWSDREIASRCSVSNTFVGNLRQELFGSQSSEEEETGSLQNAPTERLVRRGGTTYTVNTDNIGQHSSQSTGKRKRQKKVLHYEEPEPIVVRPKTIKKGEIWKLGRKHLLFCGNHSTQKFQSLIPEEIALLLIFPSKPDEWLPNMPRQAKSALMFVTSYGEDMHLETIRNAVSNIISGTTDADDTVVILNLPDPSLFLLLEDLQCQSFCAEIDPQRCTDAMTAWSVIHKSAQRV